MHKYKFNFYSRLMLQTITVYGYMTHDWNKRVFQVDKIINNNKQSIISAEVHEEACEHFENNKSSIVKESVDF